MKAELILVPELEFSKVSYVTIKVGGKEYSEFEDFYNRMGINEQDRFQRDEINRRIGRIGDKYGAQAEFFDQEELSAGCSRQHRRVLSAEGQGRLGVCLCCVRLNEELVVLLNGDRKTEPRITDCPVCAPHYNLAGRVSEAIYDAKRMGLVEITGNNILTDDSFTLQL